MHKFMSKINPILMLVLDGWNLRPASSGNALSLAKINYIDKLFRDNKVAPLTASGQAVGLRSNEVGNPDTGYLHLGVDKVVWQNEFGLVENWLSNETIDKSELKKLLAWSQEKKSKIHCIYFLSSSKRYGLLENLKNLIALIMTHKPGSKIFLHLVLDGIDTAPRNSIKLIEQVESWKKELNLEIASISGRQYGFDIDRHWDNTKKFYDILTDPSAPVFKGTAVDWLARAYTEDYSDDNLLPVCLASSAVLQDGDVVIFGNAKGTRFSQILSALISENFEEFERRKISNLKITTLTEYDSKINCSVLIKGKIEDVKSSLAKILSQNKLKQVYIGPLEREPHLTYFFPGLIRADSLDVDIRLLKKAIDYQKNPDGELKFLEKLIVKAVVKEKNDFVLVSLPHFDLAGHNGDLLKAQKAARGIDAVLKNVVPQALNGGFKVIITASHSDQEAVVHINPDKIGEEDSVSPVPFCVVGENVEASGGLINVMTVVLKLMNL
jgi:2,3-bisphosphoglycerate-independent phosphoglycerate mutase